MGAKKVLSYVASLAHKVAVFAAPALVVGLLLVSRSYGLIQYPSGRAGTLERGVDTILTQELNDINREFGLMRKQMAIEKQIALLDAKLQRATLQNATP